LRGVAADEARAVGSAHQRDVGGDQAGGGAAVIHQRGEGCPAREGFKRQSAGAREEVEDTGIGHGVAVAAAGQHIEQAFARPVGGRTQVSTRVALAHGGQRKAAVFAGNDPHAALSSALRSVAGSAMAAGSGLRPPSIRRLPTM